jgi:hypothetical protein
VKHAREELDTNMFRLSRLPLLLLLTYQLVVQAAEAPTSYVDGCSKRTLFDIIWGCVSTTIICAWAAVHPNVPPREGPVKKILRRFELMFWTIVAPEILPCWALNQYLAAMTVRDVYNEKGVLCYLLSMKVFVKRRVSLRTSRNKERNLENFEKLVFAFRDQGGSKFWWVY